MNNKIMKSLAAGAAATVVMTMIMFMAPMMGLPKMNPPAMLAVTMGFPIMVGWMMHFMIGIVFAMGYTFLFSSFLNRISNKVVNGVVFGMIAFVLAQIGMAMMGMIFTMPKMEGSMALMMLGSVIGHVLFGIVVTMIIKEKATIQEPILAKS
jgi:uncharacterized membrane protein YagU involved in acid resistance